MKIGRLGLTRLFKKRSGFDGRRRDRGFGEDLAGRLYDGRSDSVHGSHVQFFAGPSPSAETPQVGFDRMAMMNIRTADFQDREAPAGFRSRRARIGCELGMESIGASIWEIPPGEAAYPYHFHLADEELVIVLSGRPSLRTPDGIRDLQEGDAVRFPLGEEGAHQLLNRTQEAVRFLAVSNSGRPDIGVYPDSDKVRAAERLPTGDGFSASFHRGDAVDYWDGEARS